MPVKVGSLRVCCREVACTALILLKQGRLTRSTGWITFRQANKSRTFNYCSCPEKAQRTAIKDAKPGLRLLMALKASVEHSEGVIISDAGVDIGGNDESESCSGLQYQR